MFTQTIERFKTEQKESLITTCKLFGINRQVYYRAVKSLQQRKTIAQQVVNLVMNIRNLQPRIGTRKLYSLLSEKLRIMGVGRDRMFKILKANKLLIIPKRQYHVTTNSYHRFYKHKNLTEFLVLNRPEQLWVSDITYIGTRQSPMYLSLVTDAYSKKIMGYDVSTSLHAKGAISAIKKACKKRVYPAEQLIHHSDRGLQYCCDDYQLQLQKRGILCSMTEKYDPYQNAVAERINGILKHEFICGIKLKDLKKMKKLIDQSIEIYNQERPHWSCYMKTPEQMHKQRNIKIRTYKTKNSIMVNHNTI